MIAERHKRTIIDIVRRVAGRERLKVFIFGSEARGEGRFGSDIDVGLLRIDGHPLSPGMLTEIKEAFDDSSLVERVDVVDFARASARFRSTAAQQVVEL